MIYSFAGWLWELVYCRAVHGKWHLSGVLTNPLGYCNFLKERDGSTLADKENKQFNELKYFEINK
jgi:hypothetical protein